MELDAAAMDLILREGYSEEYGARNLERVVDRMLGMPLADALLSGEVRDGRVIRVGVRGGGLLLDFGGG